MKSLSTASKIVLVLCAVLLLLFSGTLAWAIAQDYRTRGLVTEGVTVAGRDLGGMTEDEARVVIEDAVSAPMLRPLTVRSNGNAWKIGVGSVVSIDVDDMVDEAYAPRRDSTLAQRLTSQLTGTPIPAEIKPKYSVDTTAVKEWVADAADELDRRSVDATRELDGYEFKVTDEVYGLQVNKKKAVKRISKALSAETALSSTDARSIMLPTKAVKPKVVASDFGQGIIVSLNQCRVYLYDGDKLVKSYRCAPGRPGFSTPTGDFKVVTKLANAPWINPGSDWAKDMPKIIPPGPNNPMGVRKVGINMPGIFFHGIPPSEFSSIGTHASHGCMRMMPSDVLDLFNRVKIGTPVYIRY